MRNFIKIPLVAASGLISQGGIMKQLPITTRCRRLIAFVLWVTCSFWPIDTNAEELATYITGEHAGVPVLYLATFDPAVKDSARLSIAVTDPTLAGRMDNIDFVPGSSFRSVIVTTQRGGGGPPQNGGLVQYNVTTGARVDIVSSTNGVAAPPASGESRPASILPNAAGSHYYYVENQFGFAGGTHRMMRVPIAGGTEEVVFDGTTSGGTLVEFSGVEIVGSDIYFFAHDTDGPATERQLYSVPLTAGLGSGPAIPLVAGLDRSGAGPPGPGSSDGSDELDFDSNTGLLYGTNIGTGEIIGYSPGSGFFASPAGLPFFIDDALVAASAAATTDDGLGLLAGVVTPGAAGPPRQIDGIRPDLAGDYLVVVGHDGVLVSIDILGVLTDGADDTDIIRLFNKDVPGAGFFNLDRASISFDDHTLLAPASAVVPEPASLLAFLVCAMVAALYSWRRREPRAN